MSEQEQEQEKEKEEKEKEEKEKEQEEKEKEQQEPEDCGICGCNLNDKFPHILKCNHTFHYECLMKSFQNAAGVGGSSKYKKACNHCPYCRKNGDYLPLVNGIKKVIPNVHCMNTTKSIQDKKLILKNDYSKKCVFILTRGKNKGSECGKNCILGHTNCKAHLK